MSEEGALREVWKGIEVSEAAIRPPFPHFQGSLADLAGLERTGDSPLLLSVRDGKSFFSQIRLDERLRRHFASPRVTVAELRDASLGGGATDEHGSPTLDKFEAVFAEAPTEPLRDETLVHTWSAAWPMGAGWASYVAQNIMAGNARRAGCLGGDVLRAGGLPRDDAFAISVATDDNLVFEGLIGDARVMGRVSRFMKALDDVWTSPASGRRPPSLRIVSCRATLLGSLSAPRFAFGSQVPAAKFPRVFHEAIAARGTTFAQGGWQVLRGVAMGAPR